MIGKWGEGKQILSNNVPLFLRVELQVIIQTPQGIGNLFVERFDDLVTVLTIWRSK